MCTLGILRTLHDIQWYRSHRQRHWIYYILYQYIYIYICKYPHIVEWLISHCKIVYLYSPKWISSIKDHQLNMFGIQTSCFSINGCFEMRLSPCLRYVGAPSEDGSVCARASSTRVQSTRGVFDKPLGFCDVHSWKNTWNMKNSDCDRVVYGSTSELTVEYYLESCHLVSIRLHGHILWR